MGLFVPRPRLSLASYAGSGVSNGLLNGLVGYWPLNEESGDAVGLGGGLTFTAENAPGNTTGKLYTYGRTLAKASEQCFYYYVYPALRGGADFTFACWFYLASHPGASPNYYFLTDNMSGNTGWCLGVVCNGNEQGFVTAAHAGGYYVAHTGFWIDPLNTWEMMFAWYDHANKTIYIQRNDSTVVPQVGSAQMVAQSTYYEGHSFGVELGGWPDRARDLWLDGGLGGVGFWSRVLSAEDRAALYNGGAGLAYEGFTT